MKRNTVYRLGTMMLVAEMRLPRVMTPEGVEPVRFTISRDTDWPDPNTDSLESELIRRSGLAIR